jgi:hypothetical protein
MYPSIDIHNDSIPIIEPKSNLPVFDLHDLHPIPHLLALIAFIRLDALDCPQLESIYIRIELLGNFTFHHRNRRRGEEWESERIG